MARTTNFLSVLGTSARLTLLLVLLLSTTSFCNSSDANEASIIHRIRQAGYNDVEIATVTDHIRVKRTLFNIRTDGRPRSKRSLEEPVNFSFSSFGETYKIEAKIIQSVLHPDAVITTFKNGKRTKWEGEHPDCYLVGNVTSHSGTVSMSCYHGLIGGIDTDNHFIHFEEIPRDHTASHTGLALVVGRKQKEERPTYTYAAEQGEGKSNVIPQENGKPNHRKKRSILSRNFTVEMAVYTDADFTAYFPVYETDRRVDLMLLKYNAVQMAWARFDMLNFDVKLSIKKMEFYESNPSWFEISLKLATMLKSFCIANKNNVPYDHYYLHSGVRETDVTGRAYQSSICNPNYRCGIDTMLSFTQFASTAHEMGHNLGMYHDDQHTPTCNGTNTGLMGGYGAGWSTCSRDDLHKFMETGKGNCLWEENVTLSNSQVEYIITSERPGQLYTADEICEMKYGKGYRFRKYPLLGVCNIHSCVNHNAGPLYGEMIKEYYYISGQYCEPSKVCFKRGCVNFTEARLYNAEVREGGWGEWGPWTGCSRTCGRGINFRRRICNNPRPQNHATCTGNEYDAYACNKTRCPDDSPEIDRLKIQRATETCEAMWLYGAINNSLYLPTGNVYSSANDGQCEVSCNPVEGYSTPAFTRFGLMPQGTPCTTEYDSGEGPRNSGSYSMCIDGLCRRFGCDNKYNGKVNDVCGVCGGDNSSCYVLKRIDTVQQPQGTRRVLQVLPVGSFDIHFSFKYLDMKQNFLELWSETGECILASRETPYVWDTRTTPIRYANTSWYYYFYSQFLYADGPINSSVVIKLFKFKTFNNTGIQVLSSELNPTSAYCGFDDDKFCGWSHTNWKRSQYRSVIPNTGPQKDRMGDFYIYLDPRDITTGDVAELITEPINPSSSHYCLLFMYYMYGENVDNLFVTLKNNVSLLWIKNGNQGNEWKCGNVGFQIYKTDQIVIRAMSGNGTDSMIALDSVTIMEKPSCSEMDCQTFITTAIPSTTVTTTEEPPIPDNIAAIIGVCVGALIVVLVIVMVACYCKRRGITHKSSSLANPIYHMPNASNTDDTRHRESDTDEGLYTRLEPGSATDVGLNENNGSLYVTPTVNYSNSSLPKVNIEDITLSNV